MVMQSGIWPITLLLQDEGYNMKVKGEKIPGSK